VACILLISYKNYEYSLKNSVDVQITSLRKNIIIISYQKKKKYSLCKLLT